MKTHTRIASLLVIIFSIILISTSSFAQTKDQKKAAKAEKIKTAVESKQYVFVAQTMIPIGFRSRQVTTPYDVSVFGDSLISYLPYMGRAYNASYGSTDSPLSFTSTQFDYSKTDRKKGGWDVVIKTKDITTDTYTYQLTIYDNGSAYLQVSGNNRQSISFDGYVTPRKTKK